MLGAYTIDLSHPLQEPVCICVHIFIGHFVTSCSYPVETQLMTQHRENPLQAVKLVVLMKLVLGVLQRFCIAFTARQAGQVKNNCYAQSAQIRKIRRKMTEIMTQEMLHNPLCFKFTGFGPKDCFVLCVPPLP